VVSKNRRASADATGLPQQAKYLAIFTDQYFAAKQVNGAEWLK
jgi:hypothetical protein